MIQTQFAPDSMIQLIAQAPPLAGGKSDAVPASTGAAPAAGTQQAPLGPGNQQPPPGAGLGLMLPFAAVLIFMIGFSWWAQSKERKKRTAMLSAIGRSDRVTTLGGIIGTVVEMRDDEVVLRVDDATNTKITFAKSAIQGVLKKSRPAEAA